MVDNAEGVAMMMKGGDSAQALLQMNDCEIYGESDALDCPTDGGFCTTYSKVGVKAHTVSYDEDKSILITGESAYPHSSLSHGNGAWDVKAEFNRVTFTGFTAETRDG